MRTSLDTILRGVHNEDKSLLFSEVYIMRTSRDTILRGAIGLFFPCSGTTGRLELCGEYSQAVDVSARGDPC